MILKKDKLNQLQGYLNNVENESNGFQDWIKLSDYEKQRIIESLNQLYKGMSLPHELLVKERNKKIF